jgi:hypothetical protein
MFIRSLFWQLLWLLFLIYEAGDTLTFIDTQPAEEFHWRDILTVIRYIFDEIFALMSRFPDLFAGCPLFSRIDLSKSCISVCPAGSDYFPPAFDHFSSGMMDRCCPA